MSHPQPTRSMGITPRKQRRVAVVSVYLAGCVDHASLVDLNRNISPLLLLIRTMLVQHRTVQCLERFHHHRETGQMLSEDALKKNRLRL